MNLKSQYREVLEHLSDEDKIKTSIEKYTSHQELSDICEYYNLRQHPLLKTLSLEKHGQDPEDAYEFSLNVIKGRWTEAEETILSDLFYAHIYAKNVIKGKWIELQEHFIEMIDDIDHEDYWYEPSGFKSNTSVGESFHFSQ